MTPRGGTCGPRSAAFPTASRPTCCARRWRSRPTSRSWWPAGWGSSGVAGAVGVVRYEQPGTESVTPPSFGLVDLQYLAAVAAYIAGGLELSEAVTGARAAAERAHAMVDSSPLPLALVARQGRVQQVNQAGCRLFGIANESQALGLHLEALGLSPSEISLHP